MDYLLINASNSFLLLIDTVGSPIKTAYDDNKLQIGHERKLSHFAGRGYPTHLGLCVM
jgi:hypothetical protein